MPSGGFEFANPAIKWLQTYTLGRTARGLTFKPLVKIKCLAVNYVLLLRFVPLSPRCMLGISLRMSINAIY